MEEKQLLELIIKKLDSVENTLSEHTNQFEAINKRLNNVESTQEILIQKVDGITEQLGKVSELEPIVQKLVKDVDILKDDVSIMKRAFRN